MLLDTSPEPRLSPDANETGAGAADPTPPTSWNQVCAVHDGRRDAPGPLAELWWRPVPLTECRPATSSTSAVSTSYTV